VRIKFLAFTFDKLGDSESSALICVDLFIDDLSSAIWMLLATSSSFNCFGVLDTLNGSMTL
jgi:hypothetical protein